MSSTELVSRIQDLIRTCNDERSLLEVFQARANSTAVLTVIRKACDRSADNVIELEQLLANLVEQGEDDLNASATEVPETPGLSANEQFDDHAILTEAIREEQAVRAAYASFLDMYLSMKMRGLVERQYRRLLLDIANLERAIEGATASQRGESRDSDISR